MNRGSDEKILLIVELNSRLVVADKVSGDLHNCVCLTLYLDKSLAVKMLESENEKLQCFTLQ